MLSAEDVERLIAGLESDRLELTVSTNKTDKFCEAICAFANDMANHRQPGYLIIGVDEKTRQVPGTVQITDQLLQNLQDLRGNGQILPLPALHVEKVDLATGSVAVVTVQPSDLPPVRYKGRTYIRGTARRDIANEQEERILSERRTTHVTTADVAPLRGASVDDLSRRLFDEYRMLAVAPEVVEANHRTPKEAMAGLRVFDLDADRPTLGGVVLFGNNPEFHLPGCYVQCLRFPKGDQGDTPVDVLRIAGDLASVVRLGQEWMRAHNQTSMSRGDDFRDTYHPDYPEFVLRELYLNALVHRDYLEPTPVHLYWFEEHIEISNPGGLFGRLKPEHLGRQSAYRNPILAEAAKTMGYVNKFGHGIARCRKLLEENGNPPLELTIDDGYFLATVRRRPR